MSGPCRGNAECSKHRWPVRAAGGASLSWPRMPVDPDSLHLRHYPDPVLRLRAKPIKLSDEVRAVAERMLDLMDDHNGIGLAAPQVGLPWRLFVSDVFEDEGRSVDDEPPSAESEATVYINPVLSAAEGDVKPYDEGCLSLPDIRGVVLRPPIITITATDLEGRQFTRRAQGLLARCWQHEVDHLDGVMIIDRMKQIYRLKNRSALRDLERGYDGPGVKL